MRLPAAALTPVPRGLDRHPVQARLVADVTAVRPGVPFTVAVVLEMAPRWHTYWVFPGDAGLPTQVTWHLPSGWRAGPLQWPVPNRYTEAGDLTVFGYADSVALLSEVRAAAPAAGVPAPGSPPPSVHLRADVAWLTCAEICIPGDTTLALDLPVGAGVADHAARFSGFRARLPRPYTPGHTVRWSPRVRTGPEGRLAVTVRVEAPRAQGAADAGIPDFYPMPLAGAAELEAGPREELAPGVARSIVEVVPGPGGEVPDSLSGLVVFADDAGRRQGRQVAFALVPTGAAAGALVDLRHADFTGGAAGTGLGLYLLMALAGGLILNLMPCVLPVISLKVLSLVSQAGQAPGRIRRLGLAFVAGILVAFLGLAATVVTIKAAGEQIGWGFQFQAPGFVLFLTALVFVLGLSLFGVVTIRLPGTTGSFGGLVEGEGTGSSFFNGVLATVLATPCTAPFLGAALGFAFTRPASTVFAVFGAAGLGMASPYLLLTWRPGWMRFLPRPGAWMERFKQAMGFLLMATVLWLLWVLGKQLGMEAVVWTGAFLLCLAVAAWVLGTWVDLRSSARRRAATWVLCVALTVLGYALFVSPLLEPLPKAGDAAASSGDGWEAFDVDRLQAHLAAGRIVFVDFTAEWCWTCKVNERTVLDRDDVRAAFSEKEVVLVKADWTRRDPEITGLMRAFGRSGVPLYVVFSPRHPNAPTVLPEVITPGIVIAAVRRAAGG